MKTRKFLCSLLLISLILFAYLVSSWTFLPSTKTLVFTGEGTYTGQLRGRTFHGQGIWRSDLGPIYIGEFKDGSFHGQGIMTFSDGATYVGEFVDGLMRHGVMTFPDGHTHEGNWDADVFLEGHEDCDHDHN